MTVGASPRNANGNAIRIIPSKTMLAFMKNMLPVLTIYRKMQ